MKKIFILCLILCLCFTFSGCNDKTPLKPDEPYMIAIKDYIDVYHLGKTDKLEKLAPLSVIDKLTTDGQFDLESHKASIKNDAELYVNNLKSLYDDDFKLTVNVNSKETLSEDIMSIIKNQMSTLYQIPTEEIKEIAQANYDILISAKEKETKQSYKIWVININDNWYTCDSRCNFGISGAY